MHRATTVGNNSKQQCLMNYRARGEDLVESRRGRFLGDRFKRRFSVSWAPSIDICSNQRVHGVLDPVQAHYDVVTRLNRTGHRETKLP